MGGAQWIGFFEVPGILLIRLMSRCNEKCLFCMVADEIAQSDDVDFDLAVQRIATQPAGTLIEFFGGEPTIYPQFLDLLRAARTREYPCSIATNMRIFHSQKFTASVASLGAPSIYVRTSIYGHDAQVHDYYTATGGSYHQTVRGVRNVVAAGFPNQVNVVILAQNYRHLPQITRQVHQWGVRRIKFGNLTNVRTCAAHVVSLASMKPYLQEAVATAETLGLSVTIEKTPICVAGRRVDLLSTERRIYGTVRSYDDAGTCGGCLVRRWCDGLDKDYADRFGFGGIERVETVPVQVIRPLGPDCQPELLKMYCVAVEDAQPDTLTMANLEHVLNRVSAKHGDLAIFPRKYLRESVALQTPTMLSQ